MTDPLLTYWNLRLQAVKEKLEENNFSVWISQTAEAAKELVLTQILPSKEEQTISWGGSNTFVQSGLYKELSNSRTWNCIDTFDKNISDEQKMERRRQALLSDVFITGTNALTESGALVNLDMIGNRTGAITFGPKHVILLIGRNKLVPDIEDAFLRIKNYSAPANVMRLEKKTPCLKTSFCHDCNSPEHICNSWTITEKSFPEGRIKIVLINEDLGL